MNIIGRRKLWYAISLLMIVPGVISLALYGLNLGREFTGGSELVASGKASTERIREVARSAGIEDVSVISGGENTTIIRYRVEDGGAGEATNRQFRQKLQEIGLTQESFDQVGPSVSRDIARNAILSIIAASIAIVLYIAFAFRNAPPPVSPWSFGAMAIVALLHDALLVLGVFSLLGRFMGVQIDAFFVTAILTVIGFSVHDTIVVFDRVRENLRRRTGSFAEIVNASILETAARSLNTSVTVIFVLLALLLFGGESIRYFVLALLIGIASGTFSSIFNASPLLVTLHEYRLKRRERDRRSGAPAKA